MRLKKKHLERPVDDSMLQIYDIARKLFDSHYYIEKLTDNDDNRMLIENFCGGEYGKGVENHLKKCAWEEMIKGDSCYYLVKDSSSREVAAYFSLKCGLLYEAERYESLSDEDRDFVNMLADAIRDNNQSLLTDYKATEMYTDDQFAKLYEDAKAIIKAEKARADNGTINVKNTYSAIEIQNICKNFNYSQPEDIKAPIGFLVFWLAIVPLIIKVSNIAGCQYAYLFAADYDYILGNSDHAKLITYYRNNFQFESIGGVALAVIKPQYDTSCYEMYSTVAKLKENMYTIWNMYSDVLYPE